MRKHDELDTRGGAYVFSILSIITFIAVNLTPQYQLYHEWGILIKATPTSLITNPTTTASQTAYIISLLLTISIIGYQGWILSYHMRAPSCRPVQKHYRQNMALILIWLISQIIAFSITTTPYTGMALVMGSWGNLLVLLLILNLWALDVLLTRIQTHHENSD